MAKYFDVYTQIPGIKPCPQVWVVESNAPDKLMSFNSLAVWTLEPEGKLKGMGTIK